MTLNPKSAIYQPNIKRTCVISLFLKYEQNNKQYCKKVASLSSELPNARYLHSGIWIVATRAIMRFRIVFGKTSNSHPIGCQAIKTSKASNDYLSLPPYYETRSQGQFKDSWGLLLRFKIISRSLLWHTFCSSFPIKHPSK